MFRVEPAPRRGRYDRASTRHERQAAQQARVVAAIAALASQAKELSVANIVEYAGIGRNTFYEYFDDAAHAVESISERMCRDLLSRAESALRTSRTPIERIRALARVWVENLVANSALATLALRVEAPRGEVSALGRCLMTLLEREKEARGPLPGLAEKSRRIAVAAVFDALSRSELAGQGLSEGFQSSLSELALRLLR
jgi:AcrR family transcriptional regulator